MSEIQQNQQRISTLEHLQLVLEKLTNQNSSSLQHHHSGKRLSFRKNWVCALSNVPQNEFSDTLYYVDNYDAIKQLQDTLAFKFCEDIGKFYERGSG